MQPRALSRAALRSSWRCVALLKILDPRNPLEDFLGLFLAGGYVVIGVRLLQSGARGDASRTAVESTAT